MLGTSFSKSLYYIRGPERLLIGVAPGTQLSVGTPTRWAVVPQAVADPMKKAGDSVAQVPPLASACFGLAEDLRDPAFAREFLFAAIDESVDLQVALGEVRAIGVKEFASRCAWRARSCCAINPRQTRRRTRSTAS